MSRQNRGVMLVALDKALGCNLNTKPGVMLVALDKALVFSQFINAYIIFWPFARLPGHGAVVSVCVGEGRGGQTPCWGAWG